VKYFNIVLLLDNVDIYIEYCIVSYRGYNCLITIFLWDLKYYKGILFLTINRVTNFNNMVLSRIYLKIKYSNLIKDIYCRI
jgi:hypothetical protein